MDKKNLLDEKLNYESWIESYEQEEIRMKEKWGKYLGEHVEINNHTIKELTLKNWKPTNAFDRKAIEFDVVLEDGFDVKKEWVVDDIDLIIPLVRYIGRAIRGKRDTIQISVRKKKKGGGYIIKEIKR